MSYCTNCGNELFGDFSGQDGICNFCGVDLEDYPPSKEEPPSCPMCGFGPTTPSPNGDGGCLCLDCAEYAAIYMRDTLS